MAYHSEALVLELEEIARQLRIDLLKMIHKRGAGHPGGSLSATDILAVLYFHQLRINPRDPNWADRDRFIHSKGHASALLYAALARKGFFPYEDLWKWGDLDCHLQGHPDRLKTPGVEMTTGFLGHGLPVGAGMAMAARHENRNSHIYVLMGDGECQGGIVWESAMMTANKHLSNLTAIVDYNDVQLDGAVHDIMPIEPFVDKWKAFNWYVIEIHGHQICEILDALDAACEIHDRPTVIIARTTKGKGVSYMENKSYWHGVAPNDDQLRQALLELGEE